MNEHTVSGDLRVIRRLILAAVAIVVALGGIFYLSTSSTDRRIERAIDDIVATRTEARYTECLRDNKQSDDAVAFARGQAEVLIDASFRNRGRAPTEAEALVNDAYIKAQEDQAAKLFPKRSCTPAAIEAFYVARNATTTTTP